MKIVYKEEELNYENLPILACENYLSVKSDKYGWIVDKKFILPFFLDTRLIFTRLVFTTGLIAKVDGYEQKDEDSFLNSAIELIGRDKICDFIYKAQSNVIFNCCPKGADCVTWGSYIVDLSKSEDELLKSFHAKHRNVVRKAARDGVIVEATDDTALIYEIISKTMQRQQVIHYPSREYIEKLVNKIPNNILILKAVKDNKSQGVAVFVFDKNWAYYMYGGSIERPYTGSINLLHFEAMKIFKEKGLQYYDFVGARISFEKGSKYEGLDRFKKRFGGELKEGVSFRYIYNPFKFKLFNILTYTYLKLKGYNYIDPIESIKKGVKK